MLIMNSSDWFNKGVDFFYNSDYKTALDCFDKAIELDPENAYAWNGKGNVLFFLNRNEQVLYCYDRAIELDPENAYAWNGKGNLLLLSALERYEEAIACYDRVLDLDSNFVDAWNNKGWALSALERYGEAITCYNTAIEINSDFVRAWYEKGVALSALERNEEAFVCFDKAIEINPNEAEAWSNKGATLSDLGRHEEAIVCFDKAIKINPDDAQVHYIKGLILEKLNKYKEAIESYNCALSIKPSHYEAATRRNTIILNMPKNQKEEYKNDELKEFDKILRYGFTVPFSNIDKADATGKLEKKMLNDTDKNVVAAKSRIEEAVKNPNTSYENQIAQCTLDEFPIVFIIYYRIKDKISPETASTLLLYCAKKMENDSIKKFGDVMRAISPQLHILFACIEFLLSLQNSFTTEIIWNGLNEYETFKADLPRFLAEERKRMGDNKFIDKYYYFENYLKEYKKFFE